MNSEQNQRKSERWLLRICAVVLCASCIDLASPDSESAGEPEAANDAAFRADSSSTLADCKWEVETGTTDLTPDCESTFRPIHGGCGSTFGGLITDNHPWEASDAANQPEDGEIWYNTSGTAGWRCAFTFDTSAQNYALALCCG